jgi:hypothetical protein
MPGGAIARPSRTGARMGTFPCPFPNECSLEYLKNARGLSYESVVREDGGLSQRRGRTAGSESGNRGHRISAFAKLRVPQTGPCSCRRTYQAQVWVAAQRNPILRSFRTLAEARAWRQQTQVAARRGEVGAPSARTFAR